LDQLRFDLATGVEPMGPAPAGSGEGEPAPAPRCAEENLFDGRRTRGVQVIVEVPLATALGVSDEPGHLQGYGWLSAPQCRELLVGAELRAATVDAETGRLLDLAQRVVRPEPTPDAVHQALRAMASQPVVPSAVSWAEESQHDPSAALERFVKLRDRYCDGPSGTAPTSIRAHLDHEVPHPRGPTSAANLVPRSPRTHALKHYGWKPVRTPTSTIWTSPAGQVVAVPREDYPPPSFDLPLPQ
ncbi:MAG TPA: HNH endonuclease signature motif containing protein, partial [Mycobacteriales bacterium]|nr:HNH endonuclease signature motif containing protein [Mycobacteriales bacterium]